MSDRFGLVLWHGIIAEHRAEEHIVQPVLHV